jgi:hypothetical protein
MYNIIICNGDIGKRQQKEIYCAACILQADAYSIIFHHSLAEGTEESVNALFHIVGISLCSDGVDVLDVTEKMINCFGVVFTTIEFKDIDHFLDEPFRSISDANVTCTLSSTGAIISLCCSDGSKQLHVTCALDKSIKISVS